MPDADAGSRSVEFTARIGAIDRERWNGLLNDGDAPFLRHEFLDLLERTGCATGARGWTPCHLVVRRHGSKRSEIEAALPLYLKGHSYGEYVFDWSWARAYQQHGLDYYPKLLSAIPFTPASTRKILTPKGAAGDVAEPLFSAIRAFCERNPVSSVHALFLEADDLRRFERFGYLRRSDHQFHWHNRGYRDFDDYLSVLTSKKRRNVRRERSALAREGVRHRWITGPRSRERDWNEMYRAYLSTIREHGGVPYLTEAFFMELAAAMGERVLLLQGLKGHEAVCSALYFRGERVLYGRYWGAARFIPNLHFETCCYQPIEYAIRHGLARFEAGAQGAHKLSRGLTPVETRSAHWLKHPRFHHAIDGHLRVERREEREYRRLLAEAAPFKSEPTR